MSKINPQAICGAKKRNGEPCQSKQMPNGRCRMHGGKVGENAGAPKGNANAVATGEFQAIWLDTLEDDEKAAIGSIDTDKAAQVERELIITEIRERRMMQRIAKLKAKGEMAIVETIDSQSEAVTENGVVPISSSHIKSESTLNQIQRIEDALTRVQGHKAKLIELKHKLETDAKGVEGDDALSSLVDALNRSRGLADG